MGGDLFKQEVGGHCLPVGSVLIRSTSDGAFVKLWIRDRSVSRIGQGFAPRRSPWFANHLASTSPFSYFPCFVDTFHLFHQIDSPESTCLRVDAETNRRPVAANPEDCFSLHQERQGAAHFFRDLPVDEEVLSFFRPFIRMGGRNGLPPHVVLITKGKSIFSHRKMQSIAPMGPDKMFLGLPVPGSGRRINRSSDRSPVSTDSRIGRLLLSDPEGSIGHKRCGRTSPGRWTIALAFRSWRVPQRWPHDGW